VVTSYKTTGSGELPSAIFVEGRQAATDYGVEIRSGGPCTVCKAGVFWSPEVLYFNCSDSYYYYNCPSCHSWIRWCRLDGTLDDFGVLKSRKTTPLSIDEYPGEPDWW